MLEIRDLHAFYGESHILHGVSLDVRKGEVVTMLGRNGAGKTTTMRSIMGIVGKRTGSIRLNGNGTGRAAIEQDREIGHRLCPGGTGHLLQPQRRGKPDVAADGEGGRHGGGGDLHAVSQPEGTAQEPGDAAVGWRAADAGDRPHPAHGRRLHPAGRTDRGLGSRDHPADRPGGAGAEAARPGRSCWSNRTSASPPPSPTGTT